MYSEFVSRPLLARVLRMALKAQSGLTAQGAAREMGKQLPSLYVTLARLRDLGLLDEAASDDKRETVFTLVDPEKREKAREILKNLKSARFSSRLANYVLGDWEERIARHLDKALTRCKVERSQASVPDIRIFCGDTIHGVEIKSPHRWRQYEDRVYGQLLRALQSTKFTSFFLVILGSIGERGTLEQMVNGLQQLTDFRVLQLGEVDVYQVLPDEEAWEQLTAERVVKPITGRIEKAKPRTGK
jgi:hypothetical protein